MLLKILIVVLILAILVSLFSGLFFLIKDDGSRRRVVNSLAIRVLLSVILIAVILVSIWQGWLELNPTPYQR